MSVAVVFHRLAAQEFVNVRRWYSQRSTTAEEKFVQAIEATLSQIAENPLSGSPTVSECRWIRVRKFPYLLYYVPSDTSNCVVYAVAHASRQFNYWRGRLKRP